MQAAILIPGEDLVAGLARDIELAAQHRPLLAIEQPGDKPHPFVHFATLLPGHLRLPQKPKSVTYVPGMICNLCARTGTARIRQSALLALTDSALKPRGCESTRDAVVQTLSAASVKFVNSGWQQCLLIRALLCPSRSRRGSSPTSPPQARSCRRAARSRRYRPRTRRAGRYRRSSMQAVDVAAWPARPRARVGPAPPQPRLPVPLA